MREKTFGYGYCVPGDRNIKVRVQAFAVGYNANHRTGRQHIGPLTRVTMDVLRVLLWNFHNSNTGRCFPSYESIAAKANCKRTSVYLAIKALEAAGVLTWCHRLVRAAGRVLRTSNGYRFRAMNPAIFPEFKKQPRQQNQAVNKSTVYEKTEYVVLDPKSALDSALIRLGMTAGFVK